MEHTVYVEHSMRPNVLPALLAFHTSYWPAFAPGFDARSGRGLSSVFAATHVGGVYQEGQ